ncbi:hypothetical protein L9F63_022102, partial [Diploptera punctata]
MDVCDFLNPTIIISRLFGLAPFTVVPHKITGTRGYKISKFWLIYSIILISFQILLQITVAYKTNYDQNEVVVTKSTEFVSQISLTIIVFIGIVTVYNSKKLTIALNKLSLISLRNSTDKNDPIMKIISLCSASFLIFLMPFSTVFLSYSLGFQSNSNFFILLFITNFPSIILPEILSINICIVLKDKFKIINLNLDPIKNSYKYYDHNMNKRQFIKLLSRFHCSLCELAEELNSVNDAQITLSVALDCIQFTNSLFTDLRVMVFNSMIKSKINQYSAITVWSSLFGVKITAFLWVCSLVCFEVSRKYN